MKGPFNPTEAQLYRVEIPIPFLLIFKALTIFNLIQLSRGRFNLLCDGDLAIPSSRTRLVDKPYKSIRWGVRLSLPVDLARLFEKKVGEIKSDMGLSGRNFLSGFPAGSAATFCNFLMKY